MLKILDKDLKLTGNSNTRYTYLVEGEGEWPQQLHHHVSPEEVRAAHKAFAIRDAELVALGILKPERGSE